MNDSHHPIVRIRARTRAVLALATAAAAIAAIAADASAAGTLPLSPAYITATAANHGLQVRPAIIGYTGDGTGFLGGAHPRSVHSGMHWTRWTTRLALGTGFNQLDNCNPSCAAGAFHGYRVKIEMWRPRTMHGARVFTRLTIWYVNSRPPGEPRHYTFTDIYAGGGFSWSPPAAQGYCVNRHGAPPAQGCANIHSLP
jgi:hypothetical protein